MFDTDKFKKGLQESFDYSTHSIFIYNRRKISKQKGNLKKSPNYKFPYLQITNKIFYNIYFKQLHLNE